MAIHTTTTKNIYYRYAASFITTFIFALCLFFAVSSYFVTWFVASFAWDMLFGEVSPRANTVFELLGWLIGIYVMGGACPQMANTLHKMLQSLAKEEAEHTKDE